MSRRNAALAVPLLAGAGIAAWWASSSAPPRAIAGARRAFGTGREPTVSDPVDVAVDPVSFRPLWLRSLDSDLLTQLSLAETEPYDAADFLTAKQREASA